MNALLTHVWGKSPAQDRVWSQVTGLSPSTAVGRLLMALNFQAFIDESATPPDGEFVLGGHIATSEAWALFAKEWEVLLPSGTLADNDRYHFKMREMAVNSERMERVPPFYRLIEEYVLLSISCRMNLAEFKRAHERAVLRLKSNMHVIVDFNMWKNPWFFAFRTLLDRFHIERGTMKDILPLDQKIDFIFDDRSEKAPILAAWDETLEKTDQEIRKYYGATPRFEDDQEFLPLQAADLWVWWVREWYEWENSPVPEAMRNFEFGKWRGKKRPYIAIYIEEDKIVSAFEEIAITNLLDEDVPKHMIIGP